MKYILVIVTSIFISILVFISLYSARFQVFHFVFSKEKIQDVVQQAVHRMQTYVDEHELKIENANKLETIMQEYRNMSMLLYDEDGENHADYVSEKEDSTYAESTYFLLAFYLPDPTIETIKFQDGTLHLLVYSYIGTSFILFYIFISLCFSMFVFVFIILSFIRKKMKYVFLLKDELSYIEYGDYSHAIPYKGNDELTVLAKQLNSLRKTLKENVEKEKKAKKANHDLVTAMSHDLRTPLTSLLGYLDILDMNIYKDEEELVQYIKKSHQKAEQIKELSDRLFQHFLVYAQSEDIKLELYSSDFVNECIEFACEELVLAGFKVNVHISDIPYQIWGEEVFIKRIIDNLVSNIKKYGKENVEVSVVVLLDYIEIKMLNKISDEEVNEESTKIGLRSVKMMIELLHGNFYYDINHDVYEATILLLKEKDMK